MRLLFLLPLILGIPFGEVISSAPAKAQYLNDAGGNVYGDSMINPMADPMISPMGDPDQYESW